MKKFLKNEKGIVLIQAIGVAAVAIVLLSQVYVGLNGSFDSWLESFDSNMNDLFGEFKFNIPTFSCEEGSHTEVLRNVHEGYTGDAYCSICGNKLRDGAYIEYNITYDADGGTMPSDYPTKYTVVSNDITLPTPTKAGHIFKGWTGSNGSTPQTAVTIPTGSTGDKSYTAEWGILSTIAAQGGWYKSSVNRNTITSVTFTTSAPSLFDESWDASASGDSSIMAYRQGTAVTVVDASGLGKIAANSDSSAMFSGFTAATSISGLDLLDTSNVTTMFCMFYPCSNLTSVGDLSNWNTQNVTNMKSVFNGCTKLTTLDVSGWNTQNATTMEAMFYGCSNLASLDLSGWNTQNVTIMQGMFYSCSSLTSLDLSGWNVEKVNNTTAMMTSCKSLKMLKLPNNLKAMHNEFLSGCSSLEKLDMPDSVTSIGWMGFAGTTALKDLKFSKNLIRIGRQCFSGSGLEIINLPEGLPEIGAYNDDTYSRQFGWSSAKVVYIPKSVKRFSHSAFNATPLETINYGGTKSEWDSIQKSRYWGPNDRTVQLICTDGTYTLWPGHMGW